MKKIQKGAVGIICMFVVVLLILPIKTDAASRLQLSSKNLTIYKGVGCGTKTITVKGIEKGVKVKWKTSNKAVATVKNGVITPRKTGKATITAQVKGKKLTCKVNVKESKPYIVKKEIGTEWSKVMTRDDGSTFQYYLKFLEVGKDIPQGKYKYVPLVEGKYHPEETVPQYHGYRGSVGTGVFCGEIKYRYDGLPDPDIELGAYGSDANTSIIEVRNGDTIVCDDGAVTRQIIFLSCRNSAAN